MTHSRESSPDNARSKIILDNMVRRISNGRPSGIMLSGGVSKQFHYLHVSIVLTSEMLLQY